MFKNIIFDWSGTLCNDLPPVIDTINRILDHHGAEPIDEATFLAEFQLPFGEFYRERLPESTHDELEALYREFFPLSQKRAEEIEHALDFVRAMRGGGRRLFVLSAATAEHFHEQAVELGFDTAWFERLYLGIRDKRDVIERVLEENGLSREETCFIGDMRHDIETARQAGITSVAVLTGYDSAEKLAPVRPDLTVADLRQLGGWFQRGSFSRHEGQADHLKISGIEIHPRIGITAEERSQPQKLEMDVTLVPVRSFEGIEDSIEETIDYHDVWRRLVERAESRERDLIETLAEDMAREVLLDRRLRAVGVEVRKFVLPNTRHVSVSIWRTR